MLSVEGALSVPASFESRYQNLGDEAEAVFESTYPKRFARFGLDRPDICLDFVPAFVRFCPDYITTDGFIEVQGMGRDRLFKVKHDKLDALCRWNREFPTDVFVWDRTARRYGTCPVTHLYVALVDAGTVGRFGEGKPYRCLHVDALPVTWTPR